jgi:2-polyprenyl-6-methoxyphenol hydroxylase-like FAD-dependent oxidoreductase
MGARRTLAKVGRMRMKIAIAGAGIGGLSAASLLAQAGHDVAMFDQFEAPRPVGSGLVIQPVGLEVLHACGAAEEVLARATPIRHMHGDEARRRKVVLSVSYGATPGRQGLGIHRAALFTALFEAAERAGARITPSSPVTGRDGAHLLIAGQRTGPFDLIVDALGARSPLSPLKARALPYGAVWATVPWPEDAAFAEDHLTQRYRKADRMLGILPIGTRRDAPGTRLAAVFYSLPTAGIEAHFARPFARWRAEAARLWPEFDSYLPAGMTHADFTPARYTHGTLRRPYAEGLVHIGDAAHRASPQLGQGANMALLDAHALALALRSAGGRIDVALRHYALARRAHVRLYQAFSAAFTPQYQSDSAALPMLRDHVLAPLSRTWPMPPVLTRLVCGDLVPPMAVLTPRRRG